MKDSKFFFDKINLKHDFMFCTVMRKPEYCKPLLEMILGISIEKIEYAEKQKAVDVTVDAKGIRLDVYVKDNNTVYNIEMQAKKLKELPKRSRYYQGLIDLDQIDKGCKYEKLPKNVVIFICDFDLFNCNKALYCFENRCIDKPDLRLQDDTLKVFVNITGNLDEVSGELKAFLQYMHKGIVTNDYTASLEKEVQSVKSNEDWRAQAVTFEMVLEDNRRLAQEEEAERLSLLVKRLVADNRLEELNNLKENRESLYKEYGIEY